MMAHVKGTVPRSVVRYNCVALTTSGEIKNAACSAYDDTANAFSIAGL